MSPYLLVALLGCRASPAPDGESAKPSAPLDTVAAATRLSLDLRGVRPTVEELEAIEAEGDDASAWTARVDTWLHDPRFGPRVRDLFAGIYLTRQDSYLFEAEDYGLDDPAAFVSAVGEEPLRILSTIAEEDLPYTEIVTADWTMADANLAAAAPVDYPDAAVGWRKVRYRDGRPATGILASNGFWWHYTTTFSNLNRGRANAVSRVLLCLDYLSRPVAFDPSVNLLDAESVADALGSNPGCVSCHATLDPLASYLFGFFPSATDTAVEAASWHRERTGLWRNTSRVSPSYYGIPGDTLEDLGRQIAADPRLTSCVTEQVYGLLHGAEPGLEQTAALASHHDDMLAGGGTLRALMASVAGAEAYRRSDLKMLSVEQLGTAVEDVTGFRFTNQGYDLLGSDTHGVRTLAGGADGVYSTRPATAPSATSVLVHARLAQAGAWHAAARDRMNPVEAHLFDQIDFDETPVTDRAAMVAQMQALRLRLFGVRVLEDSPEVESDLALWSELYALDGDPVGAWAGVLSVLLRDPAFLFY